MLKVRQTMPNRMPTTAKTDMDTNSLWDRYRNSSMTTVWSAGGPWPVRHRDHGTSKDEKLCSLPVNQCFSVVLNSFCKRFLIQPPVRSSFFFLHTLVYISPASYLIKRLSIYGFWEETSSNHMEEQQPWIKWSPAWLRSGWLCLRCECILHKKPHYLFCSL